MILKGFQTESLVEWGVIETDRITMKPWQGETIVHQEFWRAKLRAARPLFKVIHAIFASIREVLEDGLELVQATERLTQDTLPGRLALEALAPGLWEYPDWDAGGFEDLLDFSLLTDIPASCRIITLAWEEENY